MGTERQRSKGHVLVDPAQTFMCFPAYAVHRPWCWLGFGHPEAQQQAGHELGNCVDEHRPRSAQDG